MFGKDIPVPDETIHIFAVIHYSDGCQAFFRTRRAAENYILNTKTWYGDDAAFNLYISEGGLED